MRNAVSTLAFLIAIAMSTIAVAMDKPRVEDNAGFFSPNALNQANERIAQIKRDHGKDLYIETHASIPAELREQYQPEQRQQFFDAWSKQRAAELKVDGVLVLITREPSFLKVTAGGDTQRQAFLPADMNRLREAMTEQFRSQRFDHGLLAGVDLVRSTFAQSLPARGAGGGSAGAPARGRETAGERAPAGAPAPAPAPRTGSPLGGMSSWLCIGAAVLVAFFLFRAMRNRAGQTMGGYAGRGGYGSPMDPNAQQGGYYPQQPGYPGGPAPRTGGFGGGLLGGLLGGVLGGAAYDRFMRRPGDGGPGASDPGQLGGGGAVEPPPSSDIGTDFSGPSGADWGGGGGDAGGGGDFGGGGDGSGGDF
jgi:uncharacterized protein